MSREAVSGIFASVIVKWRCLFQSRLRLSTSTTIQCGVHSTLQPRVQKKSAVRHGTNAVEVIRKECHTLLLAHEHAATGRHSRRFSTSAVMTKSCQREIHAMLNLNSSWNFDQNWNIHSERINFHVSILTSWNHSRKSAEKTESAESPKKRKLFRCQSRVNNSKRNSSKRNYQELKNIILLK